MSGKPASQRGETPPNGEIKTAMYVLEAMNGPLDGKRWLFEQSIVIGRDASCVEAALPVDHAVSRRHARIDVEAERLVVADLQSSNGTILAREPISSATTLEIGEPFVVGRTMLRVLRAEDVPIDQHDA